MNAVNIIEECRTGMFLAMTAREKWSSASNGINSTGSSMPTWLIVSIVVVLVVTVTLSVVVTCKHKTQKK